MVELHYAFIKDGRVVNVGLFAQQNQELADAIVREQGYDDAVWVGETLPTKYSSYDGISFTLPTTEYLISIGVVTPTEEEPTE